MLVHLDGGVVTLTLNRPHKLNAIDNPLAQALSEALSSAAADAAVRAVLVLGAGRAFCAGRDVSAPPTDRDLELVQAVSRQIVMLDKPVVFAVHGWTVGAGFEWMLDADVALASADARFKLPEASLGVFVTGGLTATLTASAGLARAKATMLLGEAFGADEAQAWGLLWRVVPPDALEATAREAAQRLALLKPEVAARFKRVLNEVGLARFDRAIALENAAQQALQTGG